MDGEGGAVADMFNILNMRSTSTDADGHLYSKNRAEPQLRHPVVSFFNINVTLGRRSY